MSQNHRTHQLIARGVSGAPIALIFAALGLCEKALGGIVGGLQHVGCALVGHLFAALPSAIFGVLQAVCAAGHGRVFTIVQVAADAVHVVRWLAHLS